MRLLLLGWLMLALAACAPPREGVDQRNGGAQPITRSPAAAAVPRSAPTAIPGAAEGLVGWQVLYRRAGGAGGTTVDLRAVGDIMLGRLVGTIGRKRGFDYPFAQAQTLLAGDGAAGVGVLAIGNLESPLTERQSPLRPGPYRLPAPPAFAAPLRAAGFRALSLANNHALDVGPAGLADATAALSASGILALGVGPDARTAREPAFLSAGGLRIALLGLNDVGDPEDQANEGQGDPASGAAWGRAWLGLDTLEAVRRARGQADLVVVVVHWGREYDSQPTPRQREWARRLVSAGADLIVGAHPHVLQPTEAVEAEGRTGFVAYSLGNFIFDQSDSAATSTGAVLRVLLDHQGVALAAVAPVEIAGGQARPLSLRSQPALAALASLSAAPTQPAPAAAQPAMAIPGPSPLPTATPVAQGWSWDGQIARPVDIPATTRPAARPRRLPADLRGDGEPLWVNLDDCGQVEVRDGAATDAPVVWRNEAANWRVTRIDAGDLDHDGRIEVLLLLWRPEADGERLGSHPFLVGWRGGRYRVIWGGSATATPMQDVAIGDLDGDGRQELVVLEGGRAPGDPAETVSIWTWRGWMFELVWRSASGVWGELALQDLTGDGRPEIVVAPRHDQASQTR